MLWGKVSPAARMPVTVYRQAWADAMNCKNFTESPGRWVRTHQAISSQCLLAGGEFWLYVLCLDLGSCFMHEWK